MTIEELGIVRNAIKLETLYHKEECKCIKCSAFKLVMRDLKLKTMNPVDPSKDELLLES